jgi:heme A synthase
MIGVHERIGASIIVLGAVGAAWALAQVWRRVVNPAYRVYVRFLAALIALQAVFGIVLVLTGYRPHEGLHFLYGPAVLLALPVAWRLGAPLDARGEAGALLAGCVAVVLLAIRAVATGS